MPLACLHGLVLELMVFWGKPTFSSSSSSSPFLFFLYTFLSSSFLHSPFGLGFAWTRHGTFPDESNLWSVTLLILVQELLSLFDAYFFLLGFGWRVNGTYLGTPFLCSHSRRRVRPYEDTETQHLYMPELEYQERHVGIILANKFEVYTCLSYQAIKRSRG